MERAGGAASLSRRSGVPLSNLNKYLRGREMKAATLVRLAEAAAVRVEWLATGRGAMSPGDELQRELRQAEDERAATRPAAPVRGLFHRVDADRLAAAYLSARQALAVRGHPTPGARRLMQTTLAIYDALAEAEESSESRAHPQDDPQSSPQGSPDGTTKAG